MYTIKSGYHWIHNREAPLRHRRSSLLASINKHVWTSIWKLEAPPKIRLFMWCILHIALATRLDLSKRHVNISPISPICNKEDELVEHMLLLCPWVEPVWFGGQLNYKVNRFEIDTHVHSNGVPQIISVWSPPKFAWYKVNVDSSWSSTTKKGHVAAVIRDSNGRFIAARKQSDKALLEGCKPANYLELGKVIIESNSKEVVSSLSNSIYQGRWEMVPVLCKAMNMKGSFQQCLWSWVPRSANRAVDILASVKNLEMSNYTWVERPPSLIVYILKNDGLPCPH
ncbi:ribonuclease H protein [Pyrus ussuriensis x Pyrus communis]|uniref:Ribonuclease H protein n=1 Tax=Pyrus ussuriensis x Pyrus communis TaxID=2448454 RepID=A0A5N5EX31_9ROSA|nr:ribonuclease H protein [Pyrus ussuriensis x Pyrus communis]